MSSVATSIAIEEASTFSCSIPCSGVHTKDVKHVHHSVRSQKGASSVSSSSNLTTYLRISDLDNACQWISQCSNCFGRLAKSQRLDPGNFSRSTKDFRGADKGETVPLNKPLESSSFNEMENKGSTSRQQRLSSTSSQQRLSSTIAAGHRISETRTPAESDANSPYENYALRLWSERRREWVGTRERPQPAEHREPVISWITTYEDLLGTNRPFAKPIPLLEMVDFLVDVWEQEGLYE